MDLLTTIVARAREPSTWASIATLLVMAHVNISPGVWSTVTFWAIPIAAAAGIVLKERGTKSAGQVALDALNEMDAALKSAPASNGATP